MVLKMRRRPLFALSLGGTLFPSFARGQQKAMPVIGYLSLGAPAAAEVIE